MKKYVLALLTLGLLLSGSLYSENPFEKIRINGFLSQAYMKSQKNNFLTRSKQGSFEINELGLTVSTNLTDRLRFGFQLFSRDLGELGNNNVVLDWGFGDYRVSNWLGIRFGKVKAPFGLYNEGRDTDFLRPMAFLPQSLYTETYRGFIVAYQGVGLYGNLFLGGAGDISYQGYVGTNNISKEETLVKHLQNMLNLLTPMTGVTVTDMSVNTRLAAGGKVEWNTPLTGLKTAASFVHFQGDFLQHAGAPRIGFIKVPKWWIISLEYVLNNFTLASEYGEMTTNIEAFDIPLENQTNQTFYVMLSYMLTNKLTLTGLYDVFYDNKKDKKGVYFTEMGLPDHMAWRKDIGACLRYDFNPHWTIKAEYHKIDGTGLYIQLYNYGTPFERKWSYFIFKTSFNF
ncbi:MAG: hypothetical protein ACM3SY_20310 [Candidatus Omnitrophota bacterium]